MLYAGCGDELPREFRAVCSTESVSVPEPGGFAGRLGAYLSLRLTSARFAVIWHF